MTEAEVKTFRALADAATEGPWGRRIDCELQHSYSVAYGTDGTVAQRLRRDNAEFVAAARNTAERLCDALLKAWAERGELEGYVHDFARDAVPAAMLAGARRLGQDEGIAASHAAHRNRFVLMDYRPFVDAAHAVLNSLPGTSLPAEVPTARELRERAATLEAENARLREAMRDILAANDCRTSSEGVHLMLRTAREALEGVGDG